VIAASLALLSMNRLVIANEVKQSMSPEGMDRHAALAMTGSWSAFGFGHSKQGTRDDEEM
jgi:hypothetical protein